VLFVERARAVRPGFALTDDNTAAVCALCRRVDGLPLAVELAAARTVARTPAEILAEVTERLDRLGDPRRSRERHRSIDAVVARSYERLEPVEQQVFCSLAVFSGGFTAEAVASPAPTTTTLGYAGAPDAARAELAAVAGCPTVLAFCEYVGGEIRVDTDPGEALALFERARRTARTVGNRYLAAIAGVSAVSCAARAGDPTDALGGFAELLDYFDRTGSPAQQWTTIRSLIETLALL
jgi:hypothetical protein